MGTRFFWDQLGQLDLSLPFPDNFPYFTPSDLNHELDDISGGVEHMQPASSTLLFQGFLVRVIYVLDHSMLICGQEPNGESIRSSA